MQDDCACVPIQFAIKSASISNNAIANLAKGAHQRENPENETSDQFFLNKKILNFDWSDFLNEKFMVSTFWCVCCVQRQFSNISPE